MEEVVFIFHFLILQVLEYVLDKILKTTTCCTIRMLSSYPASMVQFRIL